MNESDPEITAAPSTNGNGTAPSTNGHNTATLRTLDRKLRYAEESCRMLEDLVDMSDISNFGDGHGGKDAELLQGTVQAAMPQAVSREVIYPGATAWAYINEIELRFIRAYSRVFCQTNPYAIGAIRNRVAYAIGSGHTYKVTPRGDGLDEQTIEDCRTVIEDFRKRNKWGQRQKETVRRLDRDGERFMRLFIDKEKGQINVRFIEPLEIQNPPDKSSMQGCYFGIQFTKIPDSEGQTIPAWDIEKPESYYVVNIGTLGEVIGLREEVPAAEVQHLKANVDMTWPRGLPLLWAIAPNLINAIRTLKATGMIVEFRARIGMIRRHINATRERVQKFVAGLKDGEKQRVKTAMDYPYAATIDTSDATEYQFPAGNVPVDSNVAAIQADLRAAAAAIGMPEYMLSGDASNSNYASTMVAEGPAVKNFEELQNEIIDADIEIIEQQLVIAASAGLIANVAGEQDAKNYILTLVKVEAEPPQIKSENRMEDTSADNLLVAAGAMSKETMAARAGLDYQDESEKIDREHEAAQEKALQQQQAQFEQQQAQQQAMDKATQQVGQDGGAEPPPDFAGQAGQEDLFQEWEEEKHPRHEAGEEQGRGGQFRKKEEGDIVIPLPFGAMSVHPDELKDPKLAAARLRQSYAEANPAYGPFVETFQKAAGRPPTLDEWDSFLDLYHKAAKAIDDAAYAAAKARPMVAFLGASDEDVARKMGEAPRADLDKALGRSATDEEYAAFQGLYKVYWFAQAAIYANMGGAKSLTTLAATVPADIRDQVLAAIPHVAATEQLATNAPLGAYGRATGSAIQGIGNLLGMLDPLWHGTKTRQFGAAMGSAAESGDSWTGSALNPLNAPKVIAKMLPSLFPALVAPGVAPAYFAYQGADSSRLATGPGHALANLTVGAITGIVFSKLPAQILGGGEMGEAVVGQGVKEALAGYMKNLGKVFAETGVVNVSEAEINAIAKGDPKLGKALYEGVKATVEQMGPMGLLMAGTHAPQLAAAIRRKGAGGKFTPDEAKELGLPEGVNEGDRTVTPDLAKLAEDVANRAEVVPVEPGTSLVPANGDVIPFSGQSTAAPQSSAAQPSKISGMFARARTRADLATAMDVAENFPAIEGRRKRNAVADDFRNLIGRKPTKLDSMAIPFLIESGGDIHRLLDFREQLYSTDPVPRTGVSRVLGKYKRPDVIRARQAVDHLLNEIAGEVDIPRATASRIMQGQVPLLPPGEKAPEASGGDIVTVPTYPGEIGRARLPGDPPLTNNWAKWDALRQQIADVLNTRVASEQAKGFNVPYRENYFPRQQEVNDEGASPFGSTGGGGATGFKHERKHETLADAIQVGVDPKTLSGLDLLESRVRQGTRMETRKAWAELGKSIDDPITGNPLIADPITEHSGNRVPPPGYQWATLGIGEPVCVYKPYAGIYSALTANSDIRSNVAGQALMGGVGASKHGLLLFDLYHLGRIAWYRAAIHPTESAKSAGGLAVGDTLSGASYKKGLLLLDNDDATLRQMAADGVIPKEYLPGILENRAKLDLLLKSGLNVANIAENIAPHWYRDLPVIGKYNKFLFESFQRGGMTQAALMEFDRIKTGNPGLSDADVARQVAKGINTRFGNLNNQGWIKSKTKQDLARLVFLAPQWNEGLIRSEFGALKGAALETLPAFAKGRIVAGTLTRSTAVGLLGYFAANQIINLVTRGKPTWENPEEGANSKISAWIPDPVGHGPGAFLDPLALFGEYNHQVIQRLDRDKSLTEAATEITANKAGVIPRTVMAAITAAHKDHSDWSAVKAGAAALVPLPIPTKPIATAVKAIAGGKITEHSRGEVMRQLIQSAGLKADEAPTAEQRVYSQATRYRETHKTAKGVEFQKRPEIGPGPYAELKAALSMNDKDRAVEAVKQLARTTLPGTVREYFRTLPSTMYRAIGSKADEEAFVNSLNPEEKENYEQAKKDRKAVADKFEEWFGGEKLHEFYTPEQISASGTRKRRTRKPRTQEGYDSAEPRDPHGEWTDKDDLDSDPDDDPDDESPKETPEEIAADKALLKAISTYHRAEKSGRAMDYRSAAAQQRAAAAAYRKAGHARTAEIAERTALKYDELAKKAAQHHEDMSAVNSSAFAGIQGIDEPSLGGERTDAQQEKYDSHDWTDVVVDPESELTVTVCRDCGCVEEGDYPLCDGGQIDDED